MSTPFPEELRDALDAWSFNVMLECSGSDEPFEATIGGAVLDLHDLDRILTWAIGTTNTPWESGR